MFSVVFVVYDGIEDPNITINGPSSARLSGGPMLAQNRMLAWYLCDFSGDPDQYC